MASVLYRLGGWTFDHRRAVVAIWVGVLIALGALAAALGGKVSNTFTVPGTESQRALNLLNREFPGTGGAAARIVFAAPAGHTLAEPQYRSVVLPTLRAAQQVPQTVGGASAFRQSFELSRNKRVGFGDLQFAVPVDKIANSTKAALERVAAPARRAGLAVAYSGGVVTTHSSGEGFGEIIGLVVAFIVLAIVFGRFLPATLPLITAIVGVSAGLLLINILASVVDVSSTTPTLASMLGLAVGIDYALFILSRHRQHLAEGLEPREAAARAVATAGGSVTFAGTTVVIALLGLLVVGIPFLSVMGLGAAATIVIAVLIALTLAPALLGFSGARLRKGKTIDPQTSMGHRWANFVVRNRIWAALGVIVICLAVAIPALHIRLGLPDDGTKAKDTTEYKAYTLLSNNFGPGYNGPLLLVFTGNQNSPDPEALATQFANSVRGLNNIAAVSPPIPNANGSVVIVQVTPGTSPQSEATKTLVQNIRKRVAPLSKSGLSVLVTGTTAINIDTADKLAAALPVFLPLIVILALIVLLLAFRSVLVPIKAVLGFLLTIAAAFGFVTWVFQDGNLNSLLGVPATSPVTSFLPIIMIAILFGLAMDYEVFLVSRMKESYLRTKEAVPSVIEGFSAASRVVTAAAIIMFSVFASFISSDDLVVKSFGAVLAFGVIVDAFLVRMTLVPAVLAMLKDRAWHLPGWLDRHVPDLDVEGEHLIERLDRESSEQTPGEATAEPAPAG